MNVTWDQGKTYRTEQHNLLFGAYFFLSEERQEHQKVVYGVKNIIAVVGSLTNLSFQIIRFIMRFYNRKQLEAKFIRACYFDVNESKLSSNKFN